MNHLTLLRFSFALLLAWALATAASADVVRFRYSPQPCNAHTALKPAANGATGQWRPWALSLRRYSWHCRPNATHMVTFRHPHTDNEVRVPITFPEGNPRIGYTTDSVIYSYTLYTIRVVFLRDGTVDVVYNSGLLRPPF